MIENITFQMIMLAIMLFVNVLIVYFQYKIHKKTQENNEATKERILESRKGNDFSGDYLK